MDSIKVGKYTVALTNQEKILFSKTKITKGDLVDYYHHVARYMVPHVQNRLLSMHRFPSGIHHEGFFQKDAADYFPSWVKRKKIKRQSGGTVNYVVCNNEATLVYLANLGCITMHIGLGKIDKLDMPDHMIFDIDPSQNDFKGVKIFAQQLRQLLEKKLDLPTFLMTTGSRGLHVLVPLKRIHTFDYVRDFALGCAQLLVADNPKEVTVEVRKNKRRGKIFIDTLRNAFGQTAVAPYSVRPREGAPVATPLNWNELARLKSSQQYTIKNIFKRLNSKGDVWRAIDKHACSLKPAYKKLQQLRDRQ